MREFARRYTAAWCSHDPTSVTEAARSFMTAFPFGDHDQAEYDRQLAHGVDAPGEPSAGR